ncbi:MAG: 50S ribosomal protein L3 [Candidatus Pacearchaeota archaeon]
MGKLHRPRFGSLQFWPRKRAKKEIPSVNWKHLENAQAKNRLLGFIGYKAGMKSILVKDNTPHSLTKGKNIVLPVTIVECPPLKIFSIRLYKNKRVVSEILASSIEKEIGRKLKIPKKAKNEEKDFDDVRLIVYSLVKRTGIKKTPDIAEIGLKGNAQEKFEFAKSLLNKEMNIEDFFDKNQLVDIHAVTKGKGFTGPVKRFGISLKPHKTEKGVRRPGSLGPWHPARVNFRVAMAGQFGYFTRVKYNNKIINFGKEPLEFPHYGKIKTSYVMIKGSVHGPTKRAVILTAPSRPTRHATKENYEFVRML